VGLSKFYVQINPWAFTFCPKQKIYRTGKNTCKGYKDKKKCGRTVLITVHPLMDSGATTI
jgi:hypothetical protein